CRGGGDPGREHDQRRHRDGGLRTVVEPLGLDRLGVGHFPPPGRSERAKKEGPKPLDKSSELRALRGAGNGTRTRDPQLGKLMLYQLSYSRTGSSRSSREG